MVPSVVEVTSSGAGRRTVSAATSCSRGAGAKTSVRRIRDVREPSLSVSFPNKVGGYELKIIRQPEEQHRARYLTEGSRGTVKDKTQQSHPTVKVHSSHCRVVGIALDWLSTAGQRPHRCCPLQIRLRISTAVKCRHAQL